MYVVLFHAALGFPRGELVGTWRLLRRSLAFGHEAVAIFIVLSGYCLMLPVVRSGGDRLPGSNSSFFARRAFRILPPYYAALTFSMLLIWQVPFLGSGRSATVWDDSLPGLSWGRVVSHVLLVHNLSPGWIFQINGPLWSVATEWQIYLFFPLLLLPLWRRFGALMTFAVAAFLGYLPLVLVPALAKLAIPWYLALFTLGMLAATISRPVRIRANALLTNVPWKPVTGAVWLACAVGGLFFGELWFRFKPLTDLLLGIATAFLLVYLTASADRKDRSRFLTLLSSRPCVRLGHFSYSLYLTHLPILALFFFGLRRFELSAHEHALAMIGLGAPGSLAFAYGFYLLIERHCVGQPPQLRLSPTQKSVVIKLAWLGGALALALLTLGATLEHDLHQRDFARLKEGATFVDVGGKRIRYRLLGEDKPGPLIVLMAGYAASLEQWDIGQTSLSRLAPVLTYDRAGMGLSDPSDAHDAESEADEFWALTNARGLKPPFVLVTYSVSSLIARAFMRTHPDLVAGLVFLDVVNPEQINGSSLSEKYRVRVIFERVPLMLSAKCFFGWTRLTTKLSGSRATTAAHARANAILASSSHWWAAYEEGKVIGRSSEQATLDWSRFDVPVAVLSLGNGGENAEWVRLHQLLAQQARGRFVYLSGWTHDQVSQDPKFLPYLLDLVGGVLNKARSKTTAQG